MRVPPRAVIEKRLASAIRSFLAKDDELLRRHVHERAMTHKFAEALQRGFRSWQVDCEYNKDGKVPKRIDLPERRDKSIYPDIIVHHRGLPENLLVIEAKPSDAHREDVAYDQRKLEAYITGHLGYHYAVFLTFVVGGHPDVKYELRCLTVN